MTTTTRPQLMYTTTLRGLLVISLLSLLGLVPLLTGTRMAQAAGGSNSYSVNGATGTDPATAGTCQSTPFKTIGATLACVNGDGTTTTSPDTINISAGTYDEYGLDVNGNVTIQAQAGATIDAQQLGQVLKVESGVTVSISGLTITNGVGTGVGGNGGGIYNAGILTINNSTLSNNTACSGICAGQGGGIANAGTLTINNSTLSNNIACNSFRCIGVGGGIYNQGILTISISTLSNNTACSGSGCQGQGGGIYNQGTTTVAGSIVARNQSGESNLNGDCTNAGGTITDKGYNLESRTSCGFRGTGSLQNTDPKFVTDSNGTPLLADNGGPTQTIALQAGSPAIDQIPSGTSVTMNGTSYALCPANGTTATDQRGQTRPDSGESNCDIGAYESAYPEATATLVVSGSSSSVTAGIPSSFTLTARDQYGNVATGYTGTVQFTTSDSATGVVLPTTYTFIAADNGVHTFSNGVTLVTAGSQTITATDTASSSITGAATIQVNPAAATHFTVSAPSTATVGDAVSVSVTAQDAYGNTATDYSGTVHLTSSDGQAILPTGSTLTNGMGTVSVTFKSAGTQTVTASDAGSSITGTSGGITVAPATPQISWTTPADITYGTALSATQLDATATVNGHSVAGTFVYTPAAGTIPNAGKGQTLSVSFTPTDTTDFTVPPTTSVTITVNPAPLTITPTNLSMTYRGTVPAYTWTAPFVNGDTSASLTTQPTCVAKDGSGNPVSSSTPAGVYPITCTGAVDPNYTISYQTGTLTVRYGTGGYLQPVNDTAHGETCGSPCPMSIFKAGQTIPFKFQIKDANGNIVGPDANPVTFTATYAGTTAQPVDESTLTGTPTTGTTFTWTGNMYQYNWKSPSQSGTLWLITATFANGQTIQVTIGLR